MPGSGAAVAAAAARNGAPAVKQAASSCAMAAAGGSKPANRRLELGQFANLTVIGSLLPGIRYPLSSWIAVSASVRWSNRMKPTPFDSPKIHRKACK